MCGTTDTQKNFHPYAIFLASNETSQDYSFMFSSIQKTLRNHEDYIYKPNILVADGGDQIRKRISRSFWLFK